VKSAEEQLKIVKRGIVDIVTEEDLLKKFQKSVKTGKPLNIKYGIDPTATDIHVGHTVGLNKLRQFQDLGHTAILIIGDYTAMIGDPSGRMSERPQLDRETIMKNVATYKEQAFRILDKDKVKVVFNGDWFGKMNFMDVIKMVSKFTLAQMMEHDYFDKRFKEGVPLSIHELFYPIMQGYDSVMVEADIELGGTDQRFNVIAGRYLQKESGKEPQVGLFNPILLGLDGKNKMSKSLGNYIGLNFTPEDMFGKVMSIPDTLITQYFELLTDESYEIIEAMKEAMAKGENPRDFKVKLGEAIVRKYHNEEAAAKARLSFDSLFSKKEIPYEDNVMDWNDIFENEAGVSAVTFMKKTAKKLLSIELSGADAKGMLPGLLIDEKKYDKPMITKSDFTAKKLKFKFGKAKPVYGVIYIK